MQGEVAIQVNGANVFVGPNASLKSITVCCVSSRLVNNYSRYADKIRYDCIFDMRCSSENVFERLFWIGPDRVTAPFIDRVISIRDELKQSNLSYLADEVEVLYPWWSVIRDSSRIGGYSVEFAAKILSEAKRGVENRLRLRWDFDIIPLDVSLGLEGERLVIVDLRTGSKIKPAHVSTGIAAALVYRLLYNAVAVAAHERRSILVVVEEPEEQAHPYAQFALGYLLGYLPYRLARDGLELTTMVTTHSEYVLTGILVGAMDAGAKPETRPRVYCVVPKLEERRIEISEWEPSEGIPGFFDEAFIMLAERFEVYDTLWPVNLKKTSNTANTNQE